jgi:hypothetical protein
LTEREQQGGVEKATTGISCRLQTTLHTELGLTFRLPERKRQRRHLTNASHSTDKGVWFGRFYVQFRFKQPFTEHYGLTVHREIETEIRRGSRCV